MFPATCLAGFPSAVNAWSLHSIATDLILLSVESLSVPISEVYTQRGGGLKVRDYYRGRCEIMTKKHALTGNGKYLKVLESDFKQDLFLL